MNMTSAPWGAGWAGLAAPGPRPMYRLSGRQGGEGAPLLLPPYRLPSEGGYAPAPSGSSAPSLEKLSKEALKASAPGGRPDSL